MTKVKRVKILKVYLMMTLKLTLVEKGRKKFVKNRFRRRELQEKEKKELQEKKRLENLKRKKLENQKKR